MILGLDNKMSKIETGNHTQPNAASLWSKIPTYTLYFLVGYVVYLGLNVAVSAKGIAPGYDALAYVSAAMKVNLGYFSGELDYFSWRDATGSVRWVGLPFTNTLDVLLLALLYNLIDYHIGIWVIHSGYLLLFIYFLRKIFSPATTLLLFTWAVSHTYFLHQYTNLISEMKVGMFLVLFIAFLFHEDVTKHLKSLFWITVILLLLRTINLLFILPLVVAYVMIRWHGKEQRQDIISVLKTVGLAFLILSPLLLHEIRYLIPYMYKASYSDMAQNWRDMAGVKGKLDLFKAYVAGVGVYNLYLGVVALVAACTGIVLYFMAVRSRLAVVRNYFIGTLVVFAVLMQAQTNNIMLVYWIFILLGLLVVSLMSATLKNTHLVFIACLVTPIAIGQNYVNFVRLNQDVAYNRPVAELAKGLAESFAGLDKPVMFQNYAGIGQLDFHGIEVAAYRRIGTPRVNNISYKTELSDYFGALEEANIVFIANSNFMWPTYIGVNHKTEAIANFVSDRAGQIGLIKLKRLYFDSDYSKYIDVYIRPTLHVKLKYLRFNDNWLDAETSLILKSAEPEQPLDGYRMELEVMIPSTNDPQFTFPLKATLVDGNGKVVNIVVIDHVGTNKLVFALDGLPAGAYRLIFDKTFAPPNDARQLVAIYLNATVKYWPKKALGNSDAGVK